MNGGLVVVGTVQKLHIDNIAEAVTVTRPSLLGAGI